MNKTRKIIDAALQVITLTLLAILTGMGELLIIALLVTVSNICIILNK